jgi:eukaryotic-like serine/threonine-protein kinase
MTSERWAQIEDLFHRVSECEPQERARLLAEVDDLELREEVEALVASQKSATRELQGVMRDGLDTVVFPLAGATVSHYHILSGLGVGGMGLLYRAEDIRLGRKVALKFLPEESAKDPAALTRFEREARSISALEHPNICPVYEFGEHEGQPFLVMPLLEGQTLRETISERVRGKLPLERAELLDFAIQIASGLEAAHRRGIIHRDIKPANLFVTVEGQVKILDFGLAKLRHLEIPDETALPGAGEAQQLADASVTLTGSGAAMGTAGYMSPEQVRGEELDARTDVFSFGVVLYEMATGQAAFRGGTAALRHQAILNDVTTPARKLNSRVPLRLEGILNKAMMKERAARYQSVSEMRAELETLKHNLQSKNRRVAAALAAFAVIVLVGAILRFMRHQALMGALPETTQRQLTTNSDDNIVTASAISPDGKYLAYCDQHGLEVEVRQTGQMRTVAQGEICARAEWDWSLTWFPDGATLLASGPAGGIRPNIWSVSLTGGSIHKLRDNAGAGVVSPNGLFVAFTSGGPDNREMWLMDADGSHARKLFETDGQGGFGNVRWSPDGQRLIYVKVPESSLESRALNGGPSTVIASPAPDDYDWLSDGRIIFARDGNLQELHVDSRTGQPQGKPRQLTNWAGFSLDNLSATADGKHLVFRRWADGSATYVAELSRKGTRMTGPKRLAAVEGTTYVVGWAPDSKAIVMDALRNGVVGIYRQSLEKDIAEPIVTGLWIPGAQTRSSPDRASVFYWVQAKRTSGSGRETPRDLMKVPVTGGASRLVLSASPETAWADVRCAKSPAKLCVLLEGGNGRETTFTAFDPVKGRDRELFKLGGLNLGGNWEWGWDVSPDGTSIALIKSDAKISLLSLRGRLLKEIVPKGWTYGYGFDWAADGKAWFTAGGTREGQGLLRVDLEGNARLLWPNSGNLEVAYAVPSPDGRRLAINVAELTSDNVWMIEGF